MKPPLSIRLVRSALRAFSSPLGRVADELHQLNENAQRYFAHARIPELPDEGEVERLAGERAVPPIKEEWELAVEEEIQLRREAADRAEAASKAAATEAGP